MSRTSSVPFGSDQWRVVGTGLQEDEVPKPFRSKGLAEIDEMAKRFPRGD